MATEFINPDFNNKIFYPTSRLAPIRLRTDKALVDVSLSSKPNNGDVFFSTKLYSFDGIVELMDVARLIEEYFREKLLSNGYVYITVDGVTVSSHFLYCENYLPDSFNTEYRYFLAAKVQRVYRGSTVGIAACDRESENTFDITINGLNSLGTGSQTLIWRVTKRWTSGTVINFSVDEIVNYALGKLTIKPPRPMSKVIYFTIGLYSGSKTFIIEPDVPHLTFSFRNMFNVEEFLFVSGIITAKPAVERKDAVCNGQNMYYDRLISRTYEIQTRYLLRDEIPAFEQMMNSYAVSLWADGDDLTVQITDYSFEPSTDDENLITAKFSWRFADTRPRNFEADLSEILFS